MGVNTDEIGGGSFLILAEYCNAAAGALNSLADRLRLPVYPPDPGEDVSEITLAALRFDFEAIPNEDGDCTDWRMTGDRCYGQDWTMETVFAALAPYVAPGSALCYVTEGEAWAYRWDSPERHGVVVMIPAPLQPIRVTVEGGIVQNVDRIPGGVQVEINDYDGDHEECEDCSKNEDGELFHRSIYGAGE